MAVRQFPIGAVAASLLALLWLAGPGFAQSAPDEAMLVGRANRICLSAALANRGIDKQTRGFCQCAAPVLLRHMKPESRARLQAESRIDWRPDYDDANATADDILKACPPASP
jgi:hypothetical protein